MKYSQFKAMFAITKGSFRAIFRSPSAVIFSLILPIIFIVVFGFIGGGNGTKAFSIVVADNADTSNNLYQYLQKAPLLRFKKFDTKNALLLEQQKGNLSGIINIQKTADTLSPYVVSFTSTSASGDSWPLLRSYIQEKLNFLSDSIYRNRSKYAILDFSYKRDIAQVREYKTIDFILPGQIGFSLLGAGVFGMAFTFFNLRNQLILKRFFATPIKKTYIILGEALSRIIFQLLNAIIIIGVGYLFFGFTLVHGFTTFFEMIFVSFLGLLIFMGFGFIISGLAKNDTTIPAFANMIIIPQFLLAGTFLPVDAFPKWLQPISNILPLTHFNKAMRSLAFEGLNLWQIRTEIGILILSCVIIYALAIKVFKWE